MAVDSPEDNKKYCKSYYAKLKGDPKKWAEFLQRRADYKKLKRGRAVSASCEPPVNPCEPNGQKTGESSPRPIPKEEFRVLVEERAAIMEFDGNIPGDEAATKALESLLSHWSPQ